MDSRENEPYARDFANVVSGEGLKLSTKTKVEESADFPSASLTVGQLKSRQVRIPKKSEESFGQWLCLSAIQEAV